MSSDGRSGAWFRALLAAGMVCLGIVLGASDGRSGAPFGALLAAGMIFQGSFSVDFGCPARSGTLQFRTKSSALFWNLVKAECSILEAAKLGAGGWLGAGLAWSGCNF